MTSLVSSLSNPAVVLGYDPKWRDLGQVTRQIIMITCCTIKPEWHKCGLNPQMWTIVGEYHNYIYDKMTSGQKILLATKLQTKIK